MEAFIKLTRESGKDVWLNVGAIGWFGGIDTGTRIVSVIGRDDLLVKEKPDEIVERLRSANFMPLVDL